MDRDEKRRKKSPYANTSEVAQADESVLETPGGRDDDAGISGARSDYDDEVRRTDVGAVPRSAVTAQPEPGMGAQENEDGLSESEEELRRFTEDIGTGDGREDTRELPVFDRGIAPPKV
jgi:hypothetical protein